MYEVKQIIVIRKDLNMRKGKTVAQGAHASMKVILDRMFAGPNGRRVLALNEDDPIEIWLRSGFAKICCYVNSEEELDAVHAAAVNAGLPTALIVDQGRTEFHGVPTKTCIAVGPALSTLLQPITGHLPLL